MKDLRSWRAVISWNWQYWVWYPKGLSCYNSVLCSHIWSWRHSKQGCLWTWGTHCFNLKIPVTDVSSPSLSQKLFFSTVFLCCFSLDHISPFQWNDFHKNCDLFLCQWHTHWAKLNLKTAKANKWIGNTHYTFDWNKNCAEQEQKKQKGHLRTSLGVTGFSPFGIKSKSGLAYKCNAFVISPSNLSISEISTKVNG